MFWIIQTLRVPLLIDYTYPVKVMVLFILVEIDITEAVVALFILELCQAY